jgi:hypothetical protein
MHRIFKWVPFPVSIDTKEPIALMLQYLGIVLALCGPLQCMCDTMQNKHTMGLTVITNQL